jgi:Pentapeptide repeats (8 copies)
VDHAKLKEILDRHKEWLESAGSQGARANLKDANLTRANLTRANLTRANLKDANLEDAIRTDDPKHPYDRSVPIDYAARALRYRERHPDVPAIQDLDASILRAIEAGGTLDMGTWHKCETMHCRAGWAITLAGEAGARLEKKYGPERAGGMIYKASTGRIPHFFASNEDAMADIRKCAARAISENARAR